MKSNVREVFRTVTPRNVVADAPGLSNFLREAFEVAGPQDAKRPAEIRIGNSVIVIVARGAREPFAGFLYIYVSDADAVYQRALAAGARSLEEPNDTSYGDRRAMVRDPFGNVWQIAHVIAEPST